MPLITVKATIHYLQVQYIKEEVSKHFSIEYFLMCLSASPTIVCLFCVVAGNSSYFRDLKNFFKEYTGAQGDRGGSDGNTCSPLS